MNRESIEFTANAKTLEETAASPIPAGIEAARLPGDAGYGIAVFRPDMAIPNLRTNRAQKTTIKQLKEA